ncbi:uncharacterized protein SOCE26_074750 [Sorangium cellulosum]|uniref:Uncharacterized protein n=2 Tax=Sorangium cellulosum TaxID=56 RepID=A0A2L0F369_SORCE|nr:uncharacterized protein SOCE26_074750 [Sorangium cellulosum]
MRRPHLLDVLAAAAILVAPASCRSRERVCVPGSTQTCVCPDTSRGAQSCAADGARWEPCACVPPANTAPPLDPDGDTAALRPNKIAECNTLIQVINEGVRSLDRGQEAGASRGGSSELRGMADSIDEAASRAAQLELTRPELQRFAGEYQALAKEIARAARDLATAADTNDAEKLGAAQVAIERAMKREPALAGRIKRFCQAP